MKIDQIEWHPTCCAWHGDFAEAMTCNGPARIKRGPEVEGYLVMQFDMHNKPVNTDEAGLPIYVSMTESELEKILS